MQILAKILLLIGVLSLVTAVVAKLVNMPILGSIPTAILDFTNAAFLLAIALILLSASEKK